VSAFETSEGLAVCVPYLNKHGTAEECLRVPAQLLTFASSGRPSIPMTKLLLSLLIVAGFTSTGLAQLPFIQDNYRQALTQAKHRKQPIFVECWAPW